MSNTPFCPYVFSTFCTYLGNSSSKYLRLIPSGNSLTLPLGVNFGLFAKSLRPLTLRFIACCANSKGIPISPVPIRKPKTSPGSISIPRNRVPVIVSSKNCFCVE